MGEPRTDDGVVTGVWRWMRSDPKNMTAALTLPVTAVQVAREWRWHRDNDVPWFSLSGNLAYYRARPFDAALGVLLTVLPEIVGSVAARRRPERATAAAGPPPSGDPGSRSRRG